MTFFLIVTVLLLTGLLFALCRVLAERLARKMTIPYLLREKALVGGPNGLVLADATQPDSPVVFINRAFEKMTGYSSSEILGQNCRLLQGNDREQKGLQEIRQALREQRDCRVLIRNYKKDGTPFWNDLYLAPVRNDMGRVVQYAAVLQDVTEREQTARRLATESAIIRALAESPSIYEAAPRILQAICEGQEWDFGTFWRLDPHADTLSCVDQWHAPELDGSAFERLVQETTFAYDMGVPGYVWSRKELVWLPDLMKENRFPEAPIAAQAGLMNACGFPIANRRGLQGVLVFYSRRIWPLSKNLMLLMVGTSTQISQSMDREQVETQQKELTILERGLAEFMGEGLLAMDREGYCIYANATAGKILGFPPRTLLGQRLHDVLHPAANPARCDASSCPVLLSLQSVRPGYVDDMHASFVRNNRDLLPVAYTTSPIIEKDLIQGVVITFVDASKRRAEEEEWRRSSAEKEQEIQRLMITVEESSRQKALPSPSDDVLEKIRKLLG